MRQCLQPSAACPKSWDGRNDFLLFGTSREATDGTSRWRRFSRAGDGERDIMQQAPRYGCTSRLRLAALILPDPNCRPRLYVSSLLREKTEFRDSRIRAISGHPRIRNSARIRGVSRIPRSESTARHCAWIAQVFNIYGLFSETHARGQFQWLLSVIRAGSAEILAYRGEIPDAWCIACHYCLIEWH